MRVVLVTGFEPFGDDDENPSGDAAELLDASEVGVPGHPGTARIVGRRVPVAWERAAEAVLAAVRAAHPDAVVMSGLAAGRPCICLERTFVNVRQGRDRDGAAAAAGGGEAPVVAGGPAAYAASLPLAAIAADLRTKGIPAVVSESAGTYVCNATAYRVLHALAASGSRAPAGFVHVPATPSLVARRQVRAAAAERPSPALPSMTAPAIAEALRRVAAGALRFAPPSG